MSKMSKSELNQRILKVSEVTGETKEQVMKKLLEGDVWTHLLLKTDNVNDKP